MAAYLAFMRAAVFDAYGRSEVVRIAEVPVPVPADGQVLVQVAAAALNPKDVMVTRGKFRWATGRRFPQRLGYDWSGTVTELGPGVTGLEVGTPMYGMVQSWRAGAVAENVVAEINECSPAPTAVDLVAAAAVPLASLTALQALRDCAGLRAGQRVLINGGSGGVGTFAIQIARAMGAHVTSVSSAANAALCRSLGANEAWDYGELDALTAGATFDVIFDVFGNRTFAEAAGSLTPRGVYVQTIPSARIILDVARTKFSRGRKAKLVVVRSRAADLQRITDWIDSGVVVPVIDRVLPLDDVRDGLDHLGTRRARGKIVLSMDVSTR